MTARELLPSDLAAAHALILAERAARVEAEARLAVARAEAANAQADLSSTEAFISHLKLEIEKLRRQLYGTRSERKARLLEQMELQLEELEAAATEDELAAEKAAERTQSVHSFQRRRPARKPFPDHLPRERADPPPCARPLPYRTASEFRRTACWAWMAVRLIVKTMSSTRQPRERSFTGFASPCSIGPMLTTLAERCTAL